MAKDKELSKVSDMPTAKTNQSISVGYEKVLSVAEEEQKTPVA